MPSILSHQERRILAAARTVGVIAGDGVDFDWRQAAQAAGLPADSAAEVLRGLRRFGYIDAIGAHHARLTDTGAKVADTFQKH